MRIHSTARKHGISEKDMLHAARHAVGMSQHQDFTMLLGADRSGRLLEVGVLDLDGDDPVVIHAMPMRRKYQRFLEG